MQIEDEHGQKMFCCEVECRFSMIVLAEDKESARIVADEWACEEFENIPLTDQFNIVYIKPVTEKNSIPDGWLKGIPYCKKQYEEKTVERIIEDWEIER